LENESFWRACFNKSETVKADAGDTAKPSLLMENLSNGDLNHYFADAGFPLGSDTDLGPRGRMSPNSKEEAEHVRE